MKNNQHFIWTENQEIAFEALKNELTSSTILQFYDPNKKCILVTDASNDAIGGILLQPDEYGFERPIQYVGTAFRDNEKKYSAIEREA